MSKRVRAWILVGFPLIVASFSAAIYPEQRIAIGFALTVVMFVGAIVWLTWSILWSARGNRSVAALLRGRRSKTQRPADLGEMERALGWQVYTLPEFNHRVRPILRSLLRLRLREKRGIDLDASPERAASLLSARLAPLVPVTGSGSEDGRITTQDLIDIVGELERL